MSFSRRVIATATLACLLPLSAAAQTVRPETPAAAPAAANAINPNAPVSRGELPALIRETILNDPDIIMKAIEKIRQQQADKSAGDVKAALTRHKADLFSDTTSPSVGPLNADVTMVEFFDYHCGYCKQLLPSIVKLTQEDKKVRIIFREFPILSEDSVSAARAALAVNRIDKSKYFDFYVAMMKTPGRFDEKTILDVAKKVGVNPDKLKAALNDPDSTAQLDKNRAIAEDLGIRGTPAIIIGDRLIPGAMSYDDLRNLVDEVRAEGKKGAKPAAGNSKS